MERAPAGSMLPLNRATWAAEPSSSRASPGSTVKCSNKVVALRYVYYRGTIQKCMCRFERAGGEVGIPIVCLAYSLNYLLPIVGYVGRCGFASIDMLGFSHIFNSEQRECLTAFT